MDKARLLEKHRPFIALIMRSTDIGEGWRSVSPALEKIVLGGIAEMPELYETREVDGLQVRMSERGNIVQDYL